MARGQPLRRFTNLFLLVFALDAVVSVLDDSLAAGGFHALAWLRTLVAVLTVLLSLPTFALLALAPALPRRALLPPVLFALWAGIGAPPLSAAYDASVLSGWLSLAQLAIAGLAFLGVRRWNGGEGWLLGPALEGAAFDRAHFLRFTATTVVLAPLVVVGLMVSSGALWIRAQTDHFLSLGLGGVYAQERTYVRGDKTVHLIAMVHLGDASFYRAVMESIPGGDTLVLAEGVSDDTGLLTDFPAPGELAELAASVGLTSQAELAMGDFERADVDVSDLSEETIRFLNALGSAIRADTLREGIELYVRHTETLEPEDVEEIMHDIVEVRNQHVLDRLARLLDNHERFALPWGALHMPGLEAGVLALGFTPAATQTRPVIAFW